VLHQILSVNPFRCRLWKFHDRLEEQITEDSCRDEIQSFQEHGQLVPALGRKVDNDPDHDYELIYGARRLFVARHINCPLLVEIREVSDRDAIIAMDLENRQRKDVSAYERGLSYARWLRTGLFGSQEDIAKALRISASQVSRLLKLARLPTVVVSAFGDPRDICERWAINLSEILEDDIRRTKLIRAARAMESTSPRPAAADVYRRLLDFTRRGAPRQVTQDRMVRSPEGRLLFRVRRQRDAVALILPAELASPERLRQLEGLVADFLMNPANAFRRTRGDFVAQGEGRV
jgi:ParB family chromosome partitioning protein